MRAWLLGVTEALGVFLRASMVAAYVKNEHRQWELLIASDTLVVSVISYVPQRDKSDKADDELVRSDKGENSGLNQ